jgi:hypothetical protein
MEAHRCSGLATELRVFLIVVNESMMVAARWVGCKALESGALSVYIWSVCLHGVWREAKGHMKDTWGHHQQQNM